MEKVKSLISLFPKAITLHNIQGASNAVLQRYDAAIESYKQAIKIKPDYAEAYSNMGVAQKDKGELDAAIDSCNHAIKIDPSRRCLQPFLKAIWASVFVSWIKTAYPITPPSSNAQI